MRKLLLLGVAISLLASCTKMIDIEMQLEELVKMEKLFAERTKQEGISSGFSAYLAEDAISFRPEPVKVHQLYVDNAKTPGSLSWYPEVVDISIDGDMGYTSGPYWHLKYHEEKKIKYKIKETGHYVSIWQRFGSKMRVVLDVGCVYEDPGKRKSKLYLVDAVRPFKLKNQGRVTAKAAILEAEKQFIHMINERGYVSAYNAFGHKNLRFYRQKYYPLEGLDAALAWMETQSGTQTAESLEINTSSSGDFGYSYGLEACQCEEKPEPFRQSYLRIWKRQTNGSWKIVLDLTTPVQS